MPVNHTPPAAGTWELAEGARRVGGIEITISKTEERSYRSNTERALR